MKDAIKFKYKKLTEKTVRVYIGHENTPFITKIFENDFPDRIFIISDEEVISLHLQKILGLVETIAETKIIKIRSHEKYKNIDTIKNISEEFFRHGGTSKSCVISFGGGLVGNVAGYFASSVFRGIRLIHVPTTLLAQLDSAVDVKQSINAGGVKNSMGAIFAPDAVFIDPNFTVSQDTRNVNSGLAEALKHGFAQDTSLVEYILSSDVRDVDALTEIINKTIRLKISHWENTSDMWSNIEPKVRLTHIGHTTGKILEMIDVGHFTHGEAISHGMIVEAMISSKLGRLDKSSIEIIQNALSHMNLLRSFSDIYSAHVITNNLYASNPKPLFALLTELGNPNVLSVTVSGELFKEVITEYLSSISS